MINLLPPDTKQDYRYARRNSRLLHWIGLMGLAFAGLAILSIAGLVFLQQTAKSYDRQVETVSANLKLQNQTETQQEVKDISNNLKLAVKVLSKQVLYSQMLKQLATIIPANAALSGLTINQGQNALDITADTADYTAATQLQVNLADANNKIFTKADIVNIDCSSDGTSAKRYPCKVVIRALLNTKNPYLFINNQTAGGAK